ncbi:frizzled-3-like isoform X3 [Synchiropus splendidus]|nr:frizzled-3-like isoform X3 [Synchiropus splendidus]
MWPPSLPLCSVLALLRAPGSGSIQLEPIPSHSQFSCEPIRLRMCQDLPYNSTFMPNLLNHYDQQTAALAMEPFHPMVNLGCSGDLRMFLCALYAPVCAEYGRLAPPCRSLCAGARDQCRQLMRVFGLTWPDDMDCSRFPDCDQPYPRPQDLLVTSDPADRSSTTVQRDLGFWCPRELKVAPELGYTFMGREDCSAPCPSMFFSRREVALMRYAIGAASLVCLSATLFTFLTFLLDRTRFRYPERPIIFWAVCHAMVALVFFLGFLLEDTVACNALSPPHFRAATITQGSHNKACTLSFMVLYFFTMAGSVWWVILTVTWFLAAVPKWGSEAIEKKALLFHAAAWGGPGALTVALLALDKVEGDGISGVCFVGLYDLEALRWFVLAPLCLNVAVGVGLLLLGIVALNRVRMQIPLEKENQSKLVKFMIRMGVFSALYLLPLLAVVGSHLYEHTNRRAWQTTWVRDNCRRYHIPCPFQADAGSRPALAVFLLKYLMTLVVGVPSVFWVGSRKTCLEWERFLHGRRRQTGGAEETRQVLQEAAGLAQSLLREPHPPVLRKSRGTSTQVRTRGPRPPQKPVLTCSPDRAPPLTAPPRTWPTWTRPLEPGAPAAACTARPAPAAACGAPRRREPRTTGVCRAWRGGRSTWRRRPILSSLTAARRRTDRGTRAPAPERSQRDLRGLFIVGGPVRASGGG